LLFPAGIINLHIRAAHVDDENSFLHGFSDVGAAAAESSCTTLIGINLSARGFFLRAAKLFYALARDFTELPLALSARFRTFRVSTAGRCRPAALARLYAIVQNNVESHR